MGCDVRICDVKEKPQRRKICHLRMFETTFFEDVGDAFFQNKFKIQFVELGMEPETTNPLADSCTLSNLSDSETNIANHSRVHTISKADTQANQSGMKTAIACQMSTSNCTLLNLLSIAFFASDMNSQIPQLRAYYFQRKIP